jgi:hypothetical protein
LEKQDDDRKRCIPVKLYGWRNVNSSQNGEEESCNIVNREKKMCQWRKDKKQFLKKI